MGVDVSSAVAGLDAIAAAVTAATADITYDAAERFKLGEEWNIKPGTAGNTTNPPGDLARSIDIEGPVGGEGVYESRVGPTVVYSWQREMGGPIDKLDGWMKFIWGERGLVYAHHVFQEGTFYRERAYDEILPDIEPMAIERIAEAIAEGGG